MSTRQDFMEVKQNDKHALFINTTVEPIEKISLNHFTYTKYNDEINFSRLYKISYLMEENGCAIKYQMLQWEGINIAIHCQQALMNMIDGMVAVEEFIKR